MNKGITRLTTLALAAVMIWGVPAHRRAAYAVEADTENAAESGADTDEETSGDCTDGESADGESADKESTDEESTDETAGAFRDEDMDATDDGGDSVAEVPGRSLQEEDFYIEVAKGADGSPGRTERYSYGEWLAYLEAHDNWVNGFVDIKLSDEGKKQDIALNVEKAGQTYTFWAENTEGDAAARSFTACMDTDAPMLNALVTESRCYEPARTDTEQYFAEDFILKGSFEDKTSGVDRIEYTTDFTSGETSRDGAAWREAAVSHDGMGKFDFRIALSDGCYEAIAVRACDRAGNVSAAAGFVNDKDEYIRVVVDKSEPVVEVNAVSGGRAYSGEGDNWTNQDIIFDISARENSCPYAGVYEYMYTYVKIGDAVNGDERMDVPEYWEKTEGTLEIKEDRNGYYYFQAVSKSGVTSKQAAEQRALIQHEAADIRPVAVEGVDDTKRRNEWYNKASGAPEIHFAYPEYDTGVTSGEYDAPVTIHYALYVQTDEEKENVTVENSASMGVMGSGDVTVNEDGTKDFVLTKDDLDRHVLDFGYDKATGYAQDGIYTLEYWLTDKAGNESKKQTQTYKIDSHEPTELKVRVADDLLPADSESSIVYACFYGTDVSGNASAQYGISQKGSLRVWKAKKIGEWEGMDAGAFADGENFSISANTRCFLYIQAQDYAGNVAEGWTRGIVVDNMAPNAAGGRELTAEPQGANEHGFFNGDVAVGIRIKDAPEDGNCAALMSVRSSIGKDGADTVTDRELFSFTKTLPTDEELAKASGFDSVQVVNAAANESNEAYIEVTAADRAGNTKTSVQMLKIDVTKPEITVRFDNDNAVNGSFYNRDRTATIQIRERNFDPGAVEVAITRDGQPLELPLSDWTHDEDEHRASVTFAEDGDYTMEVSCTDLADNESEKVQAGNFTIDKTAPEVAIALQAGQDAASEKDYFRSDVTAVITVTEHNFHPGGLALDIAPVSPEGAWIHDGDVHTLRIPFHGDADYHIRCACTDLAGNAADYGELSRDFTIDTASPRIAVTGVADGSANAGEVTPVITVHDRNMEAAAVTISVKTGTGQLVKNAVETAAVEDENGPGFRFTLNDMTKKADNIYYLTVSACDMAENEAALTYRFSLNRNGSSYDLGEIMELMDTRYHTYAGLGDIQIMEMNIDTVEEFDVYLSRNGALGYKAAYTKEVQGSEDTGYTYLYRIGRENFQQEGSYRLSLYSKDRAGNEINNTCDIDGNEISFIIDNTAPKAVIDGVESGMLYDAETQEIRVVVTDNFRLSEAEFTLVNEDDDVLGNWDYMELSDEGGTMHLSIPQYKGKLSLLYRAKDCAGNEIQTFRGDKEALSDFLVTTDKFVQFLHKPTQTLFGRMLLARTAASGTAAACMAMAPGRKRKWKFTCTQCIHLL